MKPPLVPPTGAIVEPVTVGGVSSAVAASDSGPHPAAFCAWTAMEYVCPLLNPLTWSVHVPAAPDGHAVVAATASSALARVETLARKFVRYAKSPVVGGVKVSVTVPEEPPYCAFGVPGALGSVTIVFDTADGEPSP